MDAPPCVDVQSGRPAPPPLPLALGSGLLAYPDFRHTELDIERYLKSAQHLKLDSDEQLCLRHLAHLESPATVSACPLGATCPLRHSTSSPINFKTSATSSSLGHASSVPATATASTGPMGAQHSKTVCKHWLRGLCKKGRACEFLHEYNLRTMPECWFFGKYGFCSNGDECMYLHVDERMRVLECMDYRRGFCPKGPTCNEKHIRRPVCPLYTFGFCPLGQECHLGHPKLESDPTPRGNPYVNSFNPFDRPRGDPDRGVGAPRGGRGNPRLQQHQQPPPHLQQQQQQQQHMDGKGIEEETGWVQTDSGPRRKRNLDEVTCFKCGQRGHYANACANPSVPGNRGGVIRGPGGRVLEDNEMMHM